MSASSKLTGTGFVLLSLAVVFQTCELASARLEPRPCVESISTWPVEREIVCAPGADIWVDYQEGEALCLCPAKAGVK